MEFPRRPQRRNVIFCVVACLSLAAAFGSPNPNLPNFQKVDDHVYRGGQPSDAGFMDLSKLGVKTVIDLRQTGEHSQADEEKIVTGLGMRYVSIPMKGMSTPKDQQVEAVLALFNDTKNGPVFVHCKRGADRTGMVVAVYRISNDRWENQKALDEAESYGMNFFERAIKHYVKDYRARTVTATAAPSAAPKTLALSQ